MAGDADAEGWSDVAAGWSQWWGGISRPAQDALISAAGVGPGTRVLDVGCGGGEFLDALRDRGASVVGVDPAAGMRHLAASRNHDVRAGDAEHLPVGDASFDVVTAVNALQFASDTTAAVREFARVLRPGGRIAVANWAEGSRNDIDVVERAVAEADETDASPDGPLRSEGGLEAALTDAGLEVTASGIALTPWSVPDDETLVRGILLGEDDPFIDEMRPVVLAAAAPFRSGEGYLLRNAFRWAVAVSP